MNVGLMREPTPSGGFANYWSYMGLRFLMLYISQHPWMSLNGRLYRIFYVGGFFQPTQRKSHLRLLAFW